MTTEIHYDRAGRKNSMSDPDMGNWSYAYDALGNLISQTDARLCRLNLDYDALNRLLTKTSDGTGCATQVNTSYAYDVGSNDLRQRTSMSDSSGSTSWSYDTRGRVAQETSDITGASPFTTAWTYNSADLPVTMTYPDAEVLTYQYNDRGQLDSVSSNLGSTYLASAAYDEAGRITSLEYGADVLRKEFSYFDWDKPQGGLLKTALTTRLTDQATSATLQSFAYTYDENANVITITEATEATESEPQPQPQIQTFAYDGLNRLIHADTSAASAGAYSERYGYDAASGNLSPIEGYDPMSGSTALQGDLTYAYDDPAHAHAVTSVTSGQSAANSYGYDANGNMITREVNGQRTVLHYDAENRLISVDTDGVPPTTTPGPLPTVTPSQTPTPTGTPATPAPTPIADGNTVSLLHMNGADGSTAFTDAKDKTWTPTGNAQIDTAQSKFGGAAGLFDGAGDTISTPDNDDFYLASGDWTIDFWVQFNTISSTANLVSQYQDASNWMDVWVGANGTRLYFEQLAAGTGTAYFYTDASFSANTWYHIAIMRNGDTPRIAINGVQQSVTGAIPIAGKTLSNLSAPLVIGAFNAKGFLNGWIDEFRISKGIARWTSDFTPPASEYIATTDKAALISPSGNIGENSNPTYTWSEVNGASQYNLWVNGPSGALIQHWYTSAQTNCNGVLVLSPRLPR